MRPPLEKCDPILGKRVNDYLESLGIQTPMVINFQDDDNRKIETITKNFEKIMEALGLDLDDDSLNETPKRVAKMYVNELLYGLSPYYFPKCTTVENKMKYNELVVEKVTSRSVCEHHFMPIMTSGLPGLGCWVGYIPRSKVLGLSKINRIVDYFSRRPQIQERLSEQVAHALMFILETKDVAVVIKAKHLCVSFRGFEDADSFTQTSCLNGVFMEESSLRSEFMGLVNC
jgi:GTP cyclohydrolase I